MIRSLVEIEEIDENYNLEASTTILDPMALFSMTTAIACGKTDFGSGGSSTSPSVFAVASSDKTIREGMAVRIRDAFETSFSMFNYKTQNCSNRPVACFASTNRNAPECQQDYPETEVDLTARVASDKFVLMFENRQELEAYTQKDNYGHGDTVPPIYFGVSFEANGVDEAWKYVIHMNRTEGISSRAGLVNNLQSGFTESEWKSLVSSGLLFFQSIVDSYIADAGEASGLKLLYTWFLNAQFVPFPIPAHNKDLFASYISVSAGLTAVLCFLDVFSGYVRHIVSEKEERVKESMRMMGASNFAFWLAWAFTYILMFTIIALIISVLLLPVFTYSSFGIIFLVFWLFGVALVSMGAAVASCFSTAKMGSLFSNIILIVTWMPTFAVNEDTSSNLLTLYSIFPPCALDFALTRILAFESAFIGATSVTIDEVTGGWSISSSLFMLIFDIFLWAALAWYLDKVVKGTYGTSKHCCFCFMCCCRKKKKAAGDSATQSLSPRENNSDIIQPPSADLLEKRAIAINNLRREFPQRGKPTHVAVKNLTLDMFEGQIFVLLGHNGAGKSTTINMLTGLLPITSGTAEINGFSAETEMEQIHKNLGVCPQHDVLFNDLTVKEHLMLYGQIKDVPKSEIEATVSISIAEIQLERQTHQRAGTLSGGQKRRLSLAIALIGGSKIVFLDEPTSGVDPFSRRAIWDLLQIKKKDRVIILTTHFMDEADQLGDRIAIMHHGGLRCCGTTLFLKKKFGVGYNIVMSREANGDVKALSSLILSHVPDGTLLSNVGTELSYRLPLGSSSSFPAMLKQLEEEGPELGCISFGLSVTTLEEVFLSVAQEGASTKEQETEEAAVIPETGPTVSVDPDAGLDTKLLEAGGNVSTARHLKALLSKRFHNAKRDKKFACCQILLPVLVLVLGLLFLNSIPFPIEPDDLPLDFSELNQPLHTPFNSKWEGKATDQAAYLGDIENVDLQDWDSDFETLEDFSAKLLETRDDHLTSRYGAFCDGSPPNLFVVNMMLAMAESNNTGAPGAGGPLGGGGKGKGGPPAGAGAGQEKATAMSYNIYSNITARTGIPMFWSLFAQGEVRKQSGNPKATIGVTLSSMPATKSEQEFFDIIKGFQTAMMVTIAVAFIPIAYVTFVVKERQVNAKHLQMISGVDISAYWTSNFLFDFGCFLMATVMFVIVLQAFGDPNYSGENLAVIVLGMVLFGMAVIPFTYLFSFLFTNAAQAQNVMLLIYFFTGLVMLIISFVLETIESTQDIAADLRFVFRLFPNFCFADVFFGLSSMGITNRFTLGDNKVSRWDMDVSGWNLVFMAVEFVVYFAGVFVIEYYSAGKGCFKAKANPSLKTKGLDRVEDADVEVEKARIKEGQAEMDLIRLEGLRRVFPTKVAVNDLWFSIPKNECFGFLGVNGAGKSTTLKMLTGDETPTQGNAFLGGKSVISDPLAVRRLMGYCPQFDAIHELMTGEETLYFYGRIRGVPEENLKQMVEYLAERLTLTQDNQHKRPAGTYSGGNKRKLSVGIALIGNPPVVFLDEPSTGMDPVSRRFMWDFIAQTMQDRAVILTTHSMEEAEALCSRIGILVHGRLRCIGSSQHLKDSYGSGFEFLLNIKDGFVDQARKFVAETFTQSKEIECYGGNMKYKLGKQDLKLSQIFSILEEKRNEMGIVDYAIGQTTLEQIFITFASNGDKELEAEELEKNEAALMDSKAKRPPSGEMKELKVESRPQIQEEEKSAPLAHKTKLGVQGESKPTATTSNTAYVR